MKKILGLSLMILTFGVMSAQSTPQTPTPTPTPTPAAPQQRPVPKQDEMTVVAPKQSSIVSDGDAHLRMLVLSYQNIQDQKQIQTDKAMADLEQKFAASLASAMAQVNSELQQIYKSNNWDPAKVQFDGQSLTFKVKKGESPFVIVQSAADSVTSSTPTTTKIKSKK